VIPVGDRALRRRWGRRRLDTLGNWQEFSQDADGNGSGVAAGQERTHDEANELTGITGNLNWVDPLHDSNSGDTIPIFLDGAPGGKVGCRHGAAGTSCGPRVSAPRHPTRQPAAAHVLLRRGLSAVCGPDRGAMRRVGRGGVGLVPDAQPRAPGIQGTQYRYSITHFGTRTYKTWRGGEPRATSREPRATSGEPRATSRELRIPDAGSRIPIPESRPSAVDCHFGGKFR